MDRKPLGTVPAIRSESSEHGRASRLEGSVIDDNRRETLATLCKVAYHHAVKLAPTMAGKWIEIYTHYELGWQALAPQQCPADERPLFAFHLQAMRCCDVAYYMVHSLAYCRCPAGSVRED